MEIIIINLKLASNPLHVYMARVCQHIDQFVFADEHDMMLQGILGICELERQLGSG